MKLNPIPIPKRYWLYAEKSEVVFVDALTFRTDNRAELKPRENRIFIQNDVPGNPRNQDQLEQSFWHELSHQVVGKTNHPELSDDEIFIDTLGSLFHQALATAEYK